VYRQFLRWRGVNTGGSGKQARLVAIFLQTCGRKMRKKEMLG
jgi:hypothetical protein